MMQAFGQLGLTTFSNGVNCFAQILGAIARSVPGMYLHVLVTGVGERKRDGVETLLTGENDAISLEIIWVAFFSRWQRYRCRQARPPASASGAAS